MISTEHRENDRAFPACVINLHDVTQRDHGHGTTTTEGITVIVQFDDISQQQWSPQRREGASP